MKTTTKVKYNGFDVDSGQIMMSIRNDEDTSVCDNSFREAAIATIHPRDIIDIQVSDEGPDGPLETWELSPRRRAVAEWADLFFRKKLRSVYKFLIPASVGAIAATDWVTDVVESYADVVESYAIVIITFIGFLVLVTCVAPRGDRDTPFVATARVYVLFGFLVALVGSLAFFFFPDWTLAEAFYDFDDSPFFIFLILMFLTIGFVTTFVPFAFVAFALRFEFLVALVGFLAFFFFPESAPGILIKIKSIMSALFILGAAWTIRKRVHSVKYVKFTCKAVHRGFNRAQPDKVKVEFRGRMPYKPFCKIRRLCKIRGD